MGVIDTIAPIVLLIALGAVLARVRFLGAAFAADLNKLAFWVALPALVFRAAATASAPADRTLALFVLMSGATVAICLLGFAVAAAAGVPAAARGTFAQAAFRGNLALVGVPVLSFGAPADLVSKAVVLMTALMVFYNFLAVIVLHGGRGSLREVMISIASNPLLLAGLLGLGWGAVGWSMPVMADRTLDALGSAAVPIALLCIGGSLAATRIAGGLVALLAASLKVAVLPLGVFLVVRWLGFPAEESRVAVVFAACPTAAASYVMAAKMGGDEALASSAVALSTLCAAPAIALALWFTA
jgi:predicted permease